jgi:hypothetical protein
MSFDVFVDSYHDGLPAGISRDTVRLALGDFVSEIDSMCWQVRYDPNNFCDLYLSKDADPNKIFGFMISRPCADVRLWEAVATILGLGALVLHFDGRVALVGSASAVAHLPKEMIEIFGEPQCVSSGREIADAIRADRDER